MKVIKRRRERVEKFLDFIIKNKEKYDFKQICALFSIVTGISTVTIGAYSRELIESGVVKINGDKVIEVVDIFKKIE